MMHLQAISTDTCMVVKFSLHKDACLVRFSGKRHSRHGDGSRTERRMRGVVWAMGGDQKNASPSIGKKKAQGSVPYTDRYRPPSKEEASLRAEAEAPFRSVRLFLFGSGAVSASLATLFGLPGLIGSIAGAPSAKSLFEAGQDLGINLGALLICGALVRNDWKQREKQMARLLREDQLGACQLELANKKVLRLAQLRGAARPVVIAGTPNQVWECIKAAEPYKSDLIDRGVIVVALPIFGGMSAGDGQSDSSSIDSDNPELDEEKIVRSLSKLEPEDLRWRATPLRQNEWKKWFKDQASAAGKELSNGLYVGLRLDGRVRASGLGCPPWGKFAASLPPTEGFFSGLLDGMDGKV